MEHKPGDNTCMCRDCVDNILRQQQRRTMKDGTPIIDAPALEETRWKLDRLRGRVKMADGTPIKDANS